MEQEPAGEEFDFAANGESINLSIARLKKLGRDIAAHTFKSEEVDRRYQDGQDRLEQSAAEDTTLQAS